MLVTIQELQHHVRTAVGTSDSTMAHAEGSPFQGVCQGNGASPTIWVAVSAPLIEMMRTAGHGLTFESPLSKQKDQFVGFAFVDDTDIVSGDLSCADITVEQVYDSIQQAIDCWEGDLKATGGGFRSF